MTAATSSCADTPGSQGKGTPTPLEAYAEARVQIVTIAERIAKDRYENIVTTYTKKGERFDGGTPLLKDLLAVASDSWGFLQSEWQRVCTGEPSEERDMRMAIIAWVWAGSREERAVGLLAEQALRDKGRRLWAQDVERITGVFHGQMSEMTASDWAKYYERFSEWWKSYKPTWLYITRNRDAVRRSAIEDATKSIEPSVGGDGKPAPRP